jgi:hypothetical protein
MFPDFDPAHVGERHVFRFKAAQHIGDTDCEAKIPDYRTPLPRVVLANFSPFLPKTAERFLPCAKDSKLPKAAGA